MTPAGRFWAASLLFSAFYSVSALAWPPTYGAEFEVTRFGLGQYDFKTLPPNGSPERQAQVELADVLRKRCAIGDCTVLAVKGKFGLDYRVIYRDGWYFQISYDPACVEITFKPSTLSELEKRISQVNQDIFGSAREIGLTVKDGESSHFNVGIRSAFDDDAKQFLRFFADYANHPDLALGSLGQDIFNAPPLSILTPEQRDALRQITQDVNLNHLTTVAEVAQAIQQRVYTATYHEFWGAEHYQAVGLKTVNRTDLRLHDAPFEMRSVWIQHDLQEFNLVAKLIEGRINYLRSIKGPVIYTGTDRKWFSPAELRTRFFIYVEEAGLRDSDFSQLLPPALQRLAIDDFANRSVAASLRLNGVEKYLDLVTTSQWVRDQIVEILSDPSVRTFWKTQQLKKNVRARYEAFISEQEISIDMRTWVQKHITRRQKPIFAVESPSAVQAARQLREMLAALKHREENSALRRSMPMVRCEQIFAR